MEDLLKNLLKALADLLPSMSPVSVLLSIGLAGCVFAIVTLWRALLNKDKEIKEVTDKYSERAYKVLGSMNMLTNAINLLMMAQRGWHPLGMDTREKDEQ